MSAKTEKVEKAETEEIIDAGTKVDDHYAKNMAPLRFWLRTKLLTLVREETNTLARLQTAVRTPLLDWYFAMTANIGTHTFYMTMLPAYFWYGNVPLGEDTVWVLALGVFITGFVKDFLCLPRPRSPPLHRISMSKSAILEYGMPSTHSCNAVSVAMYMHLYYPNNTFVSLMTLFLLVTLITGRIYTGMHGILDVTVGMALGWVCFAVREAVKRVTDGNCYVGNSITTLLFIIAISIVPSPVDDCPCFDDSTAFFGVIIGMTWSRYFYGMVPKAPYLEGFDPLNQNQCYMAFGKMLARFLVGVAMIVIWRDLSKRTLLKILPSIWIKLDQWGLRNPRRYFITISEDEKVTPDQVRDDIFELPPQLRTLVEQIKFAPDDVVGPQSAADLHEFHTNANDGPEIYSAIHIQHGRQHYDFEVFMRLVVYGGIGSVAVWAAPSLFACLNI